MKFYRTLEVEKRAKSMNNKIRIPSSPWNHRIDSVTEVSLFGQVERKDSPFFCACLQVYGCRSIMGIRGFSALTFHRHYLWQ